MMDFILILDFILMMNFKLIMDFILILDFILIMDFTSEAMKSLTACCVGAALTKVGIARAKAKQVRRLKIKYINVFFQRRSTQRLWWKKQTVGEPLQAEHFWGLKIWLKQVANKQMSLTKRLRATFQPLRLRQNVAHWFRWFVSMLRLQCTVTVHFLVNK